MNKFEIILYWSDEDQAFIAEVPELTGCAADGSTRQEALATQRSSCRNGWRPRVHSGDPFLSPRVGSCSPESYSARSVRMSAEWRNGRAKT
jgi:hypothetical protein